LFSFQIDPWLIAVTAAVMVAFITISVIWGIRAHRHQIAAGREELVGRTAEVVTTLDPKGVVFIEGERWTAVSEGGRAEPEEEVTITKVDGLKLYVTRKK